MDSKLAAIFFIVSSIDSYFNECPDECFAAQDAEARLSVQVNETYYLDEPLGSEIYAIYDLPHRFGVFQPTVGASITDQNDMWVGIGGKWTTEHLYDSPAFLELSLMPGLYAQGDGPDLGFPVMFRSTLGAGYEFDSGARVTLVIDHRSSANARSRNPGIDTVGLRYSYRFN